MRRLLCLALLLTGCNLYWNEGDDDCNYGAEGDIAPANELRNPQTGECEYWGGGGGCNDSCGPCAYDTAGALPNPDWAQCYSPCNALGEAACLTTAACQATYDDTITAGGGVPQGPVFNGCFATAPSGPVSTGTCTSLDAHECSRHDNCSMVYNPSGQGFDRCIAESSTTACGETTCSPGSHCEDQCKDTCGSGGNCGPQCTTMCVPDGDVCANVDCGAGYSCVETCIDPTPTHAGQCYGSCQQTTSCEVLTTEAACAARSDCTTVYNGEDCTCYPSTGCSCETLIYDRCESLHPQPL